MSSILDNLLSAGVAGPEVVSEQHDLSQINFVAGLSDPGEMIRCGYRPELRRLDGEADADYQARIHPLVMALPQEERDVIMGAAIRRASLDVTNGRVSVMVAGEAAWHAVGVNVAAAVTAPHARTLANMTWNAKKLPLTYLDPITGQRKFAPGHYGVVREDTGAFLNRVGPDYKVMQFDQMFDFLDQVVGPAGARYHTAGVLDGGRKCWMLIEMPRHAFAVNGNDRVEPYLMLSNSHGDESAWFFATTDRPVCGNTYRTAMGNGRRKGYCIRHTGDLKAKVEKAKEAVGLAVEGIGRFKEAAEAMTRVKVDVRLFAGEVLDQVITYTEAERAVRAGGPLVDAMLAELDADRQLVEKAVAQKEQRHARLLADMLDRHEAATNGVGGMRGTLWGAFNAVTEHADHYRPRSRLGARERAERRLESVIAGEADDLKQAAFQAAAARLN